MKQWNYRKLPCAICETAERVKGGQYCEECGKLCSRCRQAPKSKNNSWCLTCKSAALRERRKANPPSEDEYAKTLARATLCMAIKRGAIQRTPCHCGETQVIAFIPDPHVRPIVAEFLCKRHHRLRKRGLA